MDTLQTDYYQALLSRDRKFDGRFFVGVSSTGIYCRPVCRVRPPKADHCTFYPSAAAAELAGYRPCLKCRPELAPGLSPIDASSRYTQVAAQLISDGYLGEHNCDELAARLGITGRHLRRIFAEQFGASPIAYAQSQRLLDAKRLLTETDLPLGEVALAAGFGSLRRFNELFRQHYRLTPGDLRRSRQPTQSAEGLSFRLAYRPPYDWEWMLNFLHLRSAAGMERVANGAYLRTLSLTQGGVHFHGWLRVTPEPAHDRVRVDIAPSLARVVPQVLRRVRTLFDLDAQPQAIAAALGPLAAERPGLHLPGCVDTFEFAVRAVLEQQISSKAAATLTTRLAALCGDTVETPDAGVNRLFPDAATLASQSQEQLRAAGLTTRRADCVLNLARAAANGEIELDNIIDVDRGITALTALPGIGLWTATYIAMRAWSWPDAFLPTDLVVRQRFPGLTPARISAYAERWRPWRAYALLHLWHGAAPTDTGDES